MTDYTAPPSSRNVMFPADFFDRPSYRRLARRWPQALAWWMRIVLVAREALFRGQLLVGGQPLTIEDLQEVDPAGIDPEFIERLVAEGWIVGDGKALAIARWGDYYRSPSKTKEAEAERSATRRATQQAGEQTSDRSPTAGQPQGDRSSTAERPPSTAPNHTHTHTHTRPLPDPSPDPNPSRPRAPKLDPGPPPLPEDAAATLARLRAHNEQQQSALGP